MIDDKQFDLWADGYDKAVSVSDEENTYPFAGYRKVLGYIYEMVMKKPGADVLDIGFGTGVLTTKLYEHGFTIYGQDFSKRMIELAQEKMPDAHLYQGDFSKGLCEPLRQQKYDFIIATYALHHLLDEEKKEFLPALRDLLKENGRILIGDVAFETGNDLEKVRYEAGEAWDEEECYFVIEEWKEVFPNLSFVKLSDCAGVLCIEG